MAFIDRILKEPSYKWRDESGNLIAPTTKTLFAELLRRINIFKSRKNWMPANGAIMILSALPFIFFFLTKYFSLLTAVLFFVYAMFVMSTHATIWYHRYSTHKSFKFSNPFWRFITQNLVIRTTPEEAYVISHHVHHARSDEPGDPYNSKAGLMYCMLADFNHQGIATDLSENDYRKLLRFLSHTGVKLNSYEQYQKWGTLSNPFYIYSMWALNWAVWGSIFYFLGGWALVCTLFSAALVWYVLVRAFNYTGHGKGEVAHKDGIDFDRSNLSINQTRPGYFSGEWHNNHHLYPMSARSGFLPYQLDMAWVYIYILHKLGGVSSYIDNKEDFLKKYIQPEQETVTELN